MKRILSYGLILALSSLTLSGCGKNLMGPTPASPMIASAQHAISPPGIKPKSVDPACTVKGYPFKNIKHPKCLPPYYSWWRHYLGSFNYQLTLFMTHTLVQRYLVDHELKNRIYSIVRSPMFYLVVFHSGLGEELLKASLRVLSHSWVPGFGTTINGFNNPEVVLLPYRFSLHKGFFGPRLTQYNWENSDGYHCLIYNQDNDTTNIQTYSFGANIYQNEKGPYEFRWRYTYFKHDDGSHSLNLQLIHEQWETDPRLVINHETQIVEDGKYIFFNEVWAKLKDKSARCDIAASFNYDFLLKVDLTFNATGAGGGTVKIRNNTYDYVVYDGGKHGYWTKNGGHKRYF